MAVIIELIRHGETDLSARRCYQGRLDTPLSESGRKNLRESDSLHNLIYITSKRRTAETAAILFPKAEQQVVEGLQEMDFGAFEGRNYQDMAEDEAYRAWVEGGCWGRCPGGEDRASFSARVCEAFAVLVENAIAEGRKELLIVAHGGTQMAVLERWGEPKKEYYAWCTAPGMGWRLDTAAWPSALRVLGTVNYTKES